MDAEVTTRSPRERAEVTTRPQRARLSNHKDLLPGLDGRSGAARRFRDLVRAFIVDQGGVEQCSEIRLSLCRRLAATVVQAEMLEARMALGEQIDISTLCQLASTTVRIASRLGLERRAKDISTPSLSDILRGAPP